METIGLKITENIKRIISDNNRIGREAAITNLRRLYYMSLVAVPVSLAHVIIFLYFTPAESREEIIWRAGIIVAHIALMFIMTIFGVISIYMRKKASSSIFTMFIIQYVAIFLFMIVGVGIVTIDQLVTPNITPFLVACTITALVFLIRPMVSIPIYLAAYFIYYVSLSLTQNNEAILLSNQVNGITAVGIGICLSIILWNSNAKNFHQRECIEQQKDELEEINKKLFYLASHDSLTGLLNRREFEKIVNHEISRMRRYEYSSCIMIVDIDFFKDINDKYGHPAGDELLKQFSIILKNELREVDVLARWGGEEFIVLLPDTIGKDGMLVAERIRRAVENNKFNISSSQINITASFGVSELLHSDIEPFNKSYERADKALYTAKNSGRNRVVVG